MQPTICMNFIDILRNEYSKSRHNSVYMKWAKIIDNRSQWTAHLRSVHFVDTTEFIYINKK